MMMILKYLWPSARKQRRVIKRECDTLQRWSERANLDKQY